VSGNLDNLVRTVDRTDQLEAVIHGKPPQQLDYGIHSPNKRCSYLREMSSLKTPVDPRLPMCPDRKNGLRRPSSHLSGFFSWSAAPKSQSVVRMSKRLQPVLSGVLLLPKYEIDNLRVATLATKVASCGSFSRYFGAGTTQCREAISIRFLHLYL
jgi:hypothetical protein